MFTKNQTRLNLEQLSDRIVPTTAILSNGMLFIQGDNLGNNIDVAANAKGCIQVTERGQQVAISGGPATLSNVSLVVEQAGTGNNNTLATDSSLGSIADHLVGNGGGVMTFKPGNNAPSTATGSTVNTAVNDFIFNSGGKDVFTGGKGYNLYDWEPGTGTDTIVGAGKLNEVLVVGNTTGAAETDSLTSNGTGEVTYSRTNLVPFNLYTTGVQQWYIEPSTGAGNSLKIGDLTGSATDRVWTYFSGGTVNAGAQKDANIHLIVNGTQNSINEGACQTLICKLSAPTGAEIVADLVALSQQKN